jgi:flagellar basal body-associated protein FliL
LKKKEDSDGEAEAIAEGEPAEAVLTEKETDEAVLSDEVNDGDKDLSVSDEDEDSQLAEATIISEETSESDEGPVEEEGIEGNENQTEILEGDVTGQDSSVLKGFVKGNWLLQKINVAANKGVTISGLFVGLLVIVFMYKAQMMDENSGVDEPQALPVQVFLASIDGETHDALYFDRFLILLEEEAAPAYLMLSIVITPSNKKTYEEVNAKRTICRGIIYDVLQKSVTQRTQLKKYRKTLEKEILDALNRVLPAGGLEQVDLSELLVV